MAFNKFMHPRNRYKDNRPNFDALAEKYPNFSSHIVRNQSGNATLDFRDPAALRALTCTLLRDDFDLDVELPLDRLIPTLSLRLNYIHWIEDLLAPKKLADGEVVRGIDVGCGPSCIYPLLGAKMNGWHFLASEVDGLALHYARQNVSRNDLDEKITVIESTEDSMFHHILNSAPSAGQQQTYHFTMCNPPFYGNALEAQGIMGSRSMSRPEPKTVSTAAELEMIAEGGEVEFVSRMIQESLALQKQIVWYTSMLGKKSSLSAIKEELRRNNITNVTHTEFCQGRTMRWGVAWTFYDDIEPPMPASRKRKLTERCTPFTIPVSDSFIQRVLEPSQGGGLQNKIQAVARALHTMMEDLQIKVDRKPTNKWCAKFELMAKHDTWSHQRRKRRREKRTKRAQSDLLGEPQTKSARQGPSVSSSAEAAVEGITATVALGTSSSAVASSSTAASTSLSSVSASSAASTSLSTSTSPVTTVCSSSATSLSSSAASAASSSSSKTSSLEATLVHGDAAETDCPTDMSLPCHYRSTCVGTISKDTKEENFHNLPPSDSNKEQDSGPRETVGSSKSDCSYTEGRPSTSQGNEDVKDLCTAAPEQEKEQVATSSENKCGPSHSAKSSSSSSDEKDENVPLEMKLGVKLGEKRAIVIEASVADASKRNVLHQIVQYIKNQMK